MPKDKRLIQEITLDLGEHYSAWKQNEAAKETDRKAFFAWATVYATDELEPAEELVEIEAASMSDAEARLTKYYSRLKVDEVRESGSAGVYEAILVERPEFMPVSYVNATDGMVYQRQVQDGKQLLDDERLKQADPDLYERITFELPWGERIVRPFDSLDAEDLAGIQEYVYRGKPTVKLAPPRKATEEELEALDD